MKTVLLVQPKLGLLDQIPSKKTLPLSLLSIARYLVTKYKVKVIDTRLDKDWKQTLHKNLREKPVDFFSYAPDSLALLLKALRDLKDRTLIEKYRPFLQQQLKYYIKKVVDADTSKKWWMLIQVL